MTKVASSLNKQMIERRFAEPDQLWWFREVHDLNSGISVPFVSPLIPTGTKIRMVSIQIGIEPGGKPEGFHVHVFLTSRERFTIAEAILEEQVIWWTEKNTDIAYYPMCDDCEIQFPLRKTVVGSNVRFGVIMSNITNKVASCRVGILHSVP